MKIQCFVTIVPTMARNGDPDAPFFDRPKWYCLSYIYPIVCPLYFHIICPFLDNFPNANNVGKTIPPIKMVIRGMVYCCFTHIIIYRNIIFEHFETPSRAVRAPTGSWVPWRGPPSQRTTSERSPEMSNQNGEKTMVACANNAATWCLYYIYIYITVYNHSYLFIRGE